MTRTAQALALLAWFGAGCGRKEISRAAAEAGPAPSAIASTTTPRAPPELSFFYTSDLRGNGTPAEGATGAGGLARRATLVDRARIEAGVVLQVDAGDLVAVSGDRPELDTPEKLERRARLIFAAYQRMGVDVITLGERELEIAPARLRKILRATDVAVVAANIVDKKGEHPFPSDRLIGEGARSVGVFGILDPPPSTPPVGAGQEIALTDPVVAARQEVESLRGRGARVVVGLFHVAGGLAKTKEILAQASDIDVVVLGHGAEGMEAGRVAMVGRTRVVHADGLAGQVGRLDVRSLAGAKEAEYDDQLLGLPSSIPEHVGVDLLFQIDREPAVEPSSVGPDGRPIFENWTFGSNGACVLCHAKAVAQWKTTDHAHALATLKKGGHDQDRECIGCHTTGYLLAGGTRRVKTALEQFSDVGCECCHGPSVLHVRSLNKKKGTLRKVDPALCLGCHTIDRNGDLFDAVTAMKYMVGPGHGAP